MAALVQCAVDSCGDRREIVFHFKGRRRDDSFLLRLPNGYADLFYALKEIMQYAKRYSIVLQLTEKSDLYQAIQRFDQANPTQRPILQAIIQWIRSIPKLSEESLRTQLCQIRQDYCPQDSEIDVDLRGYTALHRALVMTAKPNVAHIQALLRQLSPMAFHKKYSYSVLLVNVHDAHSDDPAVLRKSLCIVRAKKGDERSYLHFLIERLTEKDLLMIWREFKNQFIELINDGTDEIFLREMPSLTAPLFVILEAGYFDLFDEILSEYEDRIHYSFLESRLFFHTIQHQILRVEFALRLFRLYKHNSAVVLDILKNASDQLIERLFQDQPLKAVFEDELKNISIHEVDAAAHSLSRLSLDTWKKCFLPIIEVATPEEQKNLLEKFLNYALQHDNLDLFLYLCERQEIPLDLKRLADATKQAAPKIIKYLIQHAVPKIDPNDTVHDRYTRLPPICFLDRINDQKRYVVVRAYQEAMGVAAFTAMCIRKWESRIDFDWRFQQNSGFFSHSVLEWINSSYGGGKYWPEVNEHKRDNGAATVFMYDLWSREAPHIASAIVLSQLLGSIVGRWHPDTFESCLHFLAYGYAHEEITVDSISLKALLDDIYEARENVFIANRHYIKYFENFYHDIQETSQSIGEAERLNETGEQKLQEVIQVLNDANMGLAFACMQAEKDGFSDMQGYTEKFKSDNPDYRTRAAYAADPRPENLERLNRERAAAGLSRLGIHRAVYRGATQEERPLLDLRADYTCYFEGGIPDTPATPLAPTEKIQMLATLKTKVEQLEEGAKRQAGLALHQQLCRYIDDYQKTKGQPQDQKQFKHNCHTAINTFKKSLDAETSRRERWVEFLKELFKKLINIVIRAGSLGQHPRFFQPSLVRDVKETARREVKVAAQRH
jgi:hypothetical protein